jgi:hypothetical protein
MAQNKTRPTIADVGAFIDAIEDQRKRGDCRVLVAMMREICGCEPTMWGDSIVGFGRYQYRYKSGRAGEFFVTGFAPRSSALTIYVMPGFESLGAQLEKLGPHRTGKSCLYLKNLDAVDLAVLRELLTDAVDIMRQRYECTF